MLSISFVNFLFHLKSMVLEFSVVKKY